MSAALVAKAVHDRLQADSGLTDIVGNRIYHGIGSTGTLMFPYIVIMVEANVDSRAPAGFTADGFLVSLTIHAFDQMSEGLARIQPIHDRIWGDCMLQATRRPSYGLHRHILELESGSAENPYGWIGGDVSGVAVSTGPDTENVVRLEMTFTTTTSRAHDPTP